MRESSSLARVISKPLPGYAAAKTSKLSPRLLALSEPSISRASAKAQAQATGLPVSGEGSLLRAPGGKILVYVRTSGKLDAAEAAIEEVGASVVAASARYRVVTVAIEPSNLKALASLPQVKAAFDALAPIRAESESGPAQPASPERPIANVTETCPGKAQISEGDNALGAAQARSAFGINGSGVEVGVLSDSYNALGEANQGVWDGELPGPGNPCGYTTPVNVIEDFSGGADEGRAMLEAVHDLAPGSSLAFASAEGGVFHMADNIEKLRSAGAKVIADDVTYLEEPMFQEGPVGLAIDRVTNAGASYFSSAGNANVVVGGQDVGSYEAPSYRPTPCPDSVESFPTEEGWPYGYADCHDFNLGSGNDNGYGYTIDPGGGIGLDLQWSEPWDGVKTDLDVFLLDADTGEILANSGIWNTCNQIPFEFLEYYNYTTDPENVEVVIARYDVDGTPAASLATPRLKYVILDNGPSGITRAEYNSSNSSDTFGPAIFGHNGGADTISVAAVPYNNLSAPEYYSSHGLVTYFFGPADGTNAASPLSSPLTINAPSLTAVDCARNSFFGSWDPVDNVYRFCGTSQAAPHAAAAAALLLSRFPALTPAQVASRLEETAHPVAGGTTASVGAGLVNAFDAANLLHASFSASPTSGVTPLTVGFTNTSTGAGSYSWTFGDGTGSTAASPVHTYTNPGTFTVTLTATGAGGTSTATATITALVSPTPAFSASRRSGYAPLSVHFTNRSKNSSSYLWSFGDHTPFSNESSPTHTFSSAGTYKVTLTARNPNGSRTKNVTVVVAPARPDLSVKVSRTASRHNGLSAFAITVTNKGGARDARVKIKIKLPTGARQTHVVFRRHSCRRSGRLITCSLSKLGSQTTARLKLTLAAAKGSKVSVSASGKLEITLANNTSSIRTR
jgi:PKD repeat protein